MPRPSAKILKRGYCYTSPYRVPIWKGFSVIRHEINIYLGRQHGKYVFVDAISWGHGQIVPWLTSKPPSGMKLSEEWEFNSQAAVFLDTHDVIALRDERSE